MEEDFLRGIIEQYARKITYLISRVYTSVQIFAMDARTKQKRDLA